jgi:uncharacterized protein YndB with AHSA1/START domain
MNPSNTLRTSRTLPHSPAAVYGAFASPRLLALWWGPDGFSNSFKVFEFHVGGSWKFVMHGPDGTEYANENMFTALEPDSKIVIEHISPPRFTLTVEITAAPKGAHIEWIQAFEDGNTARAIKHIVEPANEQNLDRLDRALGQTPSAA